MATFNVWGTVSGVAYALPLEVLLGTANQLLGMNPEADALQYKSVLINEAGDVSGVRTLGTSELATFAKGINVGNAEQADVNTLDWYQEGSWTPAIQFGGSAVGVTYGIQLGRYTRIGNLVTLTFNISLTSKGSSSGIAQISGLPLVGFSDFAQENILPCDNVTFSGQLVGRIGAGAQVMGLFSVNNGTFSAQLTDAAFANTSSIRGILSYRV